MKTIVAALALTGALALSSGAWAGPEVLVKCDGHLPDGMRFARDTGWKPFPNPDRIVTITRDNGKFTIAVEGDAPYTSGFVFPLPLSAIKSFRVMRGDGAEYFHLEKDPATGKPLLKHTIRGGRDGSHVYNIRETILANCPVVSSDVVVAEPSTETSPQG